MVKTNFCRGENLNLILKATVAMKFIMTSVAFLFVGVIIAAPSSDTVRLIFSFIEYTTKEKKPFEFKFR